MLSPVSLKNGSHSKTHESWDAISIFRFLVLAAIASALCLLMSSVLSCATLNQQVPAGCEQSMLAKSAPWSDLVLTAGVMAAKNMLRPPEYALAHEAAQVAAAVLDGNGTVITSDLVGIPGMAESLGGAILQILGANDVINPCDRARLANYFRMI